MGTQTQASFQGRLQEFFGWAYDTEKIDRDPSASLRTIKVKSTETLPLTPEQFEERLVGLSKYDAATTGIRHYGKQLGSLFIIMRWTGLRIGDVLMLARSALRGDRLSLITYKTKAGFDERVPDQVIAALAELQPRKHVHPDYFFWSGKAKYKSLVGLWEARIQAYNDGFLSFRDEDGQPMRFHSHMLRDTFAVEMLLAERTMEEVSRWLTHDSPETTRKHYNPFVERRRKQLDASKVAALQLQGATFGAM
jgi:integrase